MTDVYHIHVSHDGHTELYMGEGTSPVVSEDTGSVLDCHRSLPFWLAWDEGKIRIGKLVSVRIKPICS